MYFLHLIFHSLFAVLALTQHHGSDLDNILCYDCDLSTGDRFPHCLESSERCGHGEVCRIRYGYKVAGHLPNIQCRSQRDCHSHIHGHNTPCNLGGVEIHSEYCQICCEDNQCVTNMTDTLKLQMLASRDLFCPHRCTVDNLKECVDNGRVCDHGDYCEIRVDRARQVVGDCRDDHLWNHCQTGLGRTPCPDNLANATDYSQSASHHCYSDCCNTNECLFKRFGIHLANATFPTNSQMPVTPSVTGQGSDLWDKLHGSCVDTFSDLTCQGLKNQSDLCHSRLALSMCPKTCGICDVIQTSACRDSNTDTCLQSIGDKSLTYCNTTEAVFACPRTCNVCDKLLDSIVVSLIDGTSDSTKVPPSLLPGSTVSYPTVNCNDLRSVTCEHILPICESTFMSTVCPDECGACNDSDIF